MLTPVEQALRPAPHPRRRPSARNSTLKAGPHLSEARRLHLGSRIAPHALAMSCQMLPTVSSGSIRSSGRMPSLTRRLVATRSRRACCTSASSLSGSMTAASMPHRMPCHLQSKWRRRSADGWIRLLQGPCPTAADMIPQAAQDAQRDLRPARFLATPLLSRVRVREIKSDRQEPLAGRRLHPFQHVLIAGIIDATNMKPLGASSSSPVRSIIKVRRLSVSGCSTTVTSLRASTTSSR